MDSENWVPRTRLDQLCALLALLGGLLLLAAALVTVVSVGARYFLNSPIIGDSEIVQVLVATCIALFLPYCQLRRGNIVVDFFTTGVRPRTRARLDTVGSLLLGAMVLLLGVRAISGTASVYETGDTSMLMGIPIWWAYALIVPGLLLTALVALVTARESLAGSPEHPGPEGAE